jgi:hypothetical protein
MNITQVPVEENRFLPPDVSKTESTVSLYTESENMSTNGAISNTIIAATTNSTTNSIAFRTKNGTTSNSTSFAEPQLPVSVMYTGKEEPKKPRPQGISQQWSL